MNIKSSIHFDKIIGIFLKSQQSDLKSSNSLGPWEWAHNYCATRSFKEQSISQTPYSWRVWHPVPTLVQALSGQHLQSWIWHPWVRKVFAARPPGQAWLPLHWLGRVCCTFSSWCELLQSCADTSSQNKPAEFSENENIDKSRKREMLENWLNSTCIAK